MVNRWIPRGLAGLAAVLLAGCIGHPVRPALGTDTAFAPGTGAPLDAALAPLEAAAPDRSGFRLVSEGPEAFALRADSAALATRSIDVQTYIWRTDRAGALIARRLLEAADRGVRVRLLLDDIDARAQPFAFAALDAHPHISLRLFNPFVSRNGTVSMVVEGLGRYSRMSRRMHNKSWVVDNRLALVGGRNLGEEYFDASDAVNFVDLDLAIAGPVVREVSASFDRYWNSALAYPVAQLWADAVTPAALQRLRAELAAMAQAGESGSFASELQGEHAMQRLLAGDRPLSWSAGARFVADDPRKASGEGERPDSPVREALLAEMRAVRQELTIVSPYVMPGRAATRRIEDAARAGKRVRILTNSLAANDVVAAHGGYARRRKALVSSGVQVWELKPDPGEAAAPRSLFGSSGMSLHTKALAVDGRLLFVGSYNIDSRSDTLNCEQGVLVEDAALVRQFDALFDQYTRGSRAWSVSVVRHRVRWSDGMRVLDREPDVPLLRGLQSLLLGLLPIEEQL